MENNTEILVEELYEQVDDLHLTCFKQKTRLNNIICGYHVEYTT